MPEILTVGPDHDILTDIDHAAALRRRIEPLLAEDDQHVVLDFTGINGVSPDYLDALLGPLHERFGEQMADRLQLDGCSAALLSDLRCVAEIGRPASVSSHQTAGRRSAA